MKLFLLFRNWAVCVESGNGETGLEHNSACSCFSVIVTLSDEGLEQLYQVNSMMNQSF